MWLGRCLRGRACTAMWRLLALLLHFVLQLAKFKSSSLLAICYIVGVRCTNGVTSGTETQVTSPNTSTIQRDSFERVNTLVPPNMRHKTEVHVGTLLWPASLASLAKASHERETISESSNWTQA